MNSPPLRKYSANWGRRGDRALLAIDEHNHPVGAAWYRLFTENEQGYGFVDEETPELGIALMEGSERSRDWFDVDEAAYGGGF